MSKNSGVTGKTVPQVIRSNAAKVRQEKRDARSAAEQLVELDRRPGNAQRERARLQA